MMWVVVFFAMISAMSYFRKFWGKVDKRIKLRRRRELLTLERKRQTALARQRGSRWDSERRHDFEASRRKLNAPDLPLRPHRADRLAIQRDIDSARIPQTQFHRSLRVHHAGLVRGHGNGQDGLPVADRTHPHRFPGGQLHVNRRAGTGARRGIRWRRDSGSGDGGRHGNRAGCRRRLRGWLRRGGPGGTRGGHGWWRVSGRLARDRLHGRRRLA